MPELKRVQRDENAAGEDRAWLGREFLTWLLWRVDAGDSEFRDQAGSFTIGFGGRARLGAMAGFATDMVLKGNSPAHGAEARVAVGSGHTLSEAELRFARGDREWRFTLQADTLDLKSVKLPAMPHEAPGDAAADAEEGGRGGRGKSMSLEDRLALLEELDELVGAAYAAFLRERTRPGWRRQVAELRDWLVEGLTVE